QTNLLLVASGQAAHLLLGRGAANIQIVDHGLGMPADAPGIHKFGEAQVDEELVVNLHAGENRVELDGIVQEQSDSLAVLADQGQPRSEGAFGIVQLQGTSFKNDLSPGRENAHDAVGYAQLALAGQAANADDFSLPYLQVEALYFLAGHLDFEIPDTEDNIVADLALVGAGTLHDNLASHHQFGDFMLVGVLGGLGHHKLAVPQN